MQTRSEAFVALALLILAVALSLVVERVEWLLAADDAERLSLTAANALAKWPVVIGARSSGDAPSVSSVCMGMACNGTSSCRVETPVDAVGAAIGDGFLRILCVAAKAG